MTPPDDPPRWVVHLPTTHTDPDTAARLVTLLRDRTADLPALDLGEVTLSEEDDQTAHRRVFCDRRLTGGRCARRDGHEGPCAPARRPRPEHTRREEHRMVDVDRFLAFQALARTVVTRLADRLEARTQRYLRSLADEGEWTVAVIGCVEAVVQQRTPVSRDDVADVTRLFDFLSSERHRLAALSPLVVDR